MSFLFFMPQSGDVLSEIFSVLFVLFILYDAFREQDGLISVVGAL